MQQFKFRNLLAALDFRDRLVREYKGVVVQVTDSRVVVMDTRTVIKDLAIRMGGSYEKA